MAETPRPGSGGGSIPHSRTGRGGTSIPGSPAGAERAVPDGRADHGHGAGTGDRPSGRADHERGAGTGDRPSGRDRTDKFGAREASGIVRCDAFPILCRIKPGKLGASDRYANENGVLLRTDPLVLTARALESGAPVVPFAGESQADWDGSAFTSDRTFVTGIGSGTTYPDYKPAPFIVAAEYEGVDTVTVVSEGIFSYCGVKVKIDTDRYLGPECATIRVEGEPVGHVTTAEYGSQMLSIGRGEPAHWRHPPSRTDHLRDAARALQLRSGGARHRGRQHRGDAGRPRPGSERRGGAAHAGRVRVGHRRHVRATVARARGRSDRGRRPHHRGADRASGRRVPRHAAGRHPGARPQVHPGTLLPRWRIPAPAGGGTDITEPLTMIRSIDPSVAWPGMRVLLTTTTGEDSLYCILDEDRQTLRPAPIPDPVRVVVDRIGENCEPSLCSVLFMAGAGGSLRAGVTENPILLTDSIKSAATRVTMGGRAGLHLAGGAASPSSSTSPDCPSTRSGYVPTPAIVAPIEFTVPVADYEALGGHLNQAIPLSEVLVEAGGEADGRGWDAANPWPWKPVGRR